MVWRPSTLTLIYFSLISGVIARTFKHTINIDVFNQPKSGKLYEVQTRTFEFAADGTINISLSCDQPLSAWDSKIPFNIFLCVENPKTNWLYLYPDWGMCFERKYQYHHCSMYPLIQSHSTAWSFNLTVPEDTYLVSRVRTCPVYTTTSLSAEDRSLSMNGAYQLVAQYKCDFTGIFLNSNTRLSMDELWNPWMYRVLCIVYGLLVFKAAFEITKYWKYRVTCSFFVYSLVFFKFLHIYTTVWYYQRVLDVEDLTAGYEDYEFVMAMTQAAKFTAYYMTLLLISHGYCVYNTQLVFGSRFYVGFGSTVFCVFTYMFMSKDGYLEVACVVITAAGLAAILSLVWAFHFKRLLLVRYAFYNLRDWQGHAVAREQLLRKEVLIGVAFTEIIAFLAFIIVFEFYNAESFPVPGSTGSLVIEIFDFLLIFPLTLTFNMRDLAKYYPEPRPPPIIHVIKTPDDGYKISLSEENEKTELYINEATSEIHLIRLPSRQSMEMSEFGVQESDI